LKRAATACAARNPSTGTVDDPRRMKTTSPTSETSC
jgi:hypothetical protein